LKDLSQDEAKTSLVGQVLETPDGMPYIGEVSERQFLARIPAMVSPWEHFSVLIRDLVTGNRTLDRLFAPS
jgi:hypothetical protein